MSETVTSSVPEKKISTRQMEMLLEVLGDKITDDDKSKLIDEGIVVSRTRKTTRRGWMIDNGEPVYPSLSFKGLNGRQTTRSMEDFRSAYYELLEKHVDVVSKKEEEKES